MNRNPRKIEQYSVANLECARIIVRDIDRYGGEGALPVRWAQLVLQRDAERNVTADRRAA